MNDIHEILLFGFLISVLGWLIVSTIVFVWWFLKTETRDRFTERHEHIATAVFIGAFISFWLVLYRGIEPFLGFIPGDWGGYDEDSIPTRSSIAITLGGLLSFFFVCVFYRVEKIREENRRLAADVESQKEHIERLAIDQVQKQRADAAIWRRREALLLAALARLRHHGVDFLREKQDKIEAKLDEHCESSSTPASLHGRALDAENEGEWDEMLDVLLEESQYLEQLAYWLRNTGQSDASDKQ